MHRRPIIAIVAHDVGGLGGMERHLEELVTRLKQHADVILVASTLNLADPTGIRFIRIRVPKRPAPLKIILFALMASIRILYLKFDILHTTGAIILNRSDVSTVHFCHAGYVEATGGARAKNGASLLHRLNQSISTKLAVLMERVIYKPARSREIVAVSSRVKSEVLQHFPYKSPDVHTISNGVDVHRFVPVTLQQKRLMRRDKGLPEEGIYMLFMGGDWGLKGLDYVIRAFNQVSRLVPNLYLIVVGQGNWELYSRHVSSDLEGHVHFVGRQTDPQIWFGLSDAFVFPSSYETFSLVVHEAAACGLVIFSTRVGGVEDLIQDGYNGIFIQRDVTAITERVHSVVSNIESYRQMGENARIAVAGLTWEKMFNEFQAIYHRILNSKEEDHRRWRIGNITSEEKRYSGAP